jgi:murein L,D-transpeptidase YafK
MKARLIISFLTAATLLVLLTQCELCSTVQQRLSARKTVNDRLKQYGDAARARLKPFFDKAQREYPPGQLVLVGLKEEKQLQVYAAASNGAFHLVHTYRILAASGGPGPKLKEGDRQVPEGVYPIESLNPNSRFHLSLRVGYPNTFDREQAKREGRTGLGGDIMIHGSAVSIGCLAMGDEAAEDLFVLAADTGLRNAAVILSPVDFRQGKTVPPGVKLPPWTEKLYADIKTRLKDLPLEKE